jgi:fructose-1,6-bisphosphatase/inositol monophosphatase family enzyme
MISLSHADQMLAGSFAYALSEGLPVLTFQYSATNEPEKTMDRVARAVEVEESKKMNTVKAILLEAGAILKKRYYEKQNYGVKERFHLLSQADIEMDTFISKRLTEKFPAFSICSEESETLVHTEDARWILDPIDGTTNFIMGNPYFAISLALVRAGEVIEGHVYNPLSDEYFFASVDTDYAYMNDKQIGTAQTAQLSEALVAFGYSAKMEVIEAYYSVWKKVFTECRKGIGWVAPALSICNVARGRIDAFIDTGCSTQGQAAGSFILKKASGKMFDNAFREYDYRSKGAIFCSAAIAGALRNAFNESARERK